MTYQVAITVHVPSDFAAATVNMVSLSCSMSYTYNFTNTSFDVFPRLTECINYWSDAPGKGSGCDVINMSAWYAQTSPVWIWSPYLESESGLWMTYKIIPGLHCPNVHLFIYLFIYLNKTYMQDNISSTNRCPLSN